MTALPPDPTAGWRHRATGRAAIASGVVGILTLAVLVAGVSAMLTAAPAASATAGLLFKIHHVGIVLQSLVMVPVAFTLQALAQERDAEVSRVPVALGVTALLLTVLLALLFVVDVVADDLYTVPQAFLGPWIIIESRRQFPGPARGFARFGTVVGIGLLLVGTFPLAYALFGIRLVSMDRSRQTIPTRTLRRTRSSMMSSSSARSWASIRTHSGPSCSAAVCTGRSAAPLGCCLTRVWSPPELWSALQPRGISLVARRCAAYPGSSSAARLDGRRHR